ncbi:hypothetical protein MJO29_013521 [Puccinia striiformis f. sp. tritici]|nr:hypothetical protein MJO29_013521 [Puccinia striiformis f. sp. tritici]
MSDNSSPIAPIRMVLPNSPVPPSPALLASPIPGSPLPDIFTQNTFSLPQNGPTIFPSFYNPQGVPGSLGEENVSNLLAGLNIANPDRDSLLFSHAQTIAVMQTQARRSDDSLKKAEDHIRELRLENSNMRSNYQQELFQLRTTIESFNNNTSSRLNRLEEIDSRRDQVVKQHIPPPQHNHIAFSGAVAETHKFIGMMRNIFARSPESFPNDKHKILYVSSYFKSPSGNLGDPCSSYTWWEDVLKRNARIQGLNPADASGLDPFKIDELTSCSEFFKHIKQRFISKTWLQDTWKKIESLRQRNTNISDFNIIFSDLAEILDLNGINACKLYDAAIDQRIVRLGAYRGNYSDVVDFDYKMDRAVELANDSAGMSIVEANSQTKHVTPTRVEYRMVNPLPQNSQNKLPPGVPMDLDSALAEVGFNFQAFREECHRRNLCVRCGKGFDGAHVARRGCPLPEDEYMKKSEVLSLWKEWGGYLKEDNMSERSRWAPSTRQDGFKGKKRESISEAEAARKRGGSSAPVASGSNAIPVGNSINVDSISHEEISYTDAVLLQQLGDDDIFPTVGGK